MLFVKLRQMHPDDRERVVVDTPSAEWFPGLTRGIAVLLLHAFGSERVSLVRWAPNIRFVLVTPTRAARRSFVLDGAVEDDEGRYMAGLAGCAIRRGSQHEPFSLDGCLLYVKIGHLPAVTA
ncbi:MAG: cupin domain-containing protein [Rhodospirillales bacterium]